MDERSKKSRKSNKTAEFQQKPMESSEQFKIVNSGISGDR
jgi:hypothetical protein